MDKKGKKISGKLYIEYNVVYKQKWHYIESYGGHFSSCVSVIRIITSQEHFFISFPPMDNAAFCNFCFAETSLSFAAEPVESMCN